VKHHNIRPIALILLSATITGIGLGVAHLIDASLGRAPAIIVEWPDGQ